MAGHGVLDEEQLPLSPFAMEQRGRNARAGLVSGGERPLERGPAGPGPAAAPVLAALLIALPLASVGGMYLNDAFDAAIDRRGT